MKHFIQITIVAALVSIASRAIADEDFRSYSQGKVFIEYGAFDKDSKTEDELTRIKRCGSCPGIDGYLPFTETLNLGLVVRGDKFLVHTSLVSPLYNLHVGPKFYERTFTVKETKNVVMVSVSGGDGAGSYDVEFDINLIDMQVVRKLYQYPDRETPTITTGEVVYAAKTP
jgi:hypothetical protein